MSILYISDYGMVLGRSGGRCVVTKDDEEVTSIPLETLEGVTLLSDAVITSQCMKEFLQRGITVCYFSKGGKYFGRLISTSHVNTARQRLQCALYNSPFALELSKHFVEAKLNNQHVVLYRYSEKRGIDVSAERKMLRNMEYQALRASDNSELIGCEGMGAKAYFAGLGKCVDEEFFFQGRSRRPPKDEVNSLLSLGYSILLNEIYTKIEIKGLSPYFGFMHKDAEKHPTLASDLMEEWRPIIVDSTVMAVINGHELKKEDFELTDAGCYVSKTGLSKFISKLTTKLETKTSYLDYVDYKVNFRIAMQMQLDSLVKAMETGDPSYYKAIKIR